MERDRSFLGGRPDAGIGNRVADLEHLSMVPAAALSLDAREHPRTELRRKLCPLAKSITGFEPLARDISDETAYRH